MIEYALQSLVRGNHHDDDGDGPGEEGMGGGGHFGASSASTWAGVRARTYENYRARHVNILGAL